MMCERRLKKVDAVDGKCHAGKPWNGISMREISSRMIRHGQQGDRTEHDRTIRCAV